MHHITIVYMCRMNGVFVLNVSVLNQNTIFISFTKN